MKLILASSPVHRRGARISIYVHRANCTPYSSYIVLTALCTELITDGLSRFLLRPSSTCPITYDKSETLIDLLGALDKLRRRKSDNFDKRMVHGSTRGGFVLSAFTDDDTIQNPSRLP